MKSIIKEITVINEGTIRFPVLPNGSGWKSTETDKLSILESGKNKVLFAKIIKAIDSAKQMICLQSYLIQDTELIDCLIRAVEERQVKVFVLSCADARLKNTIEEEQDFIKADYIKLLDHKFKNHFVHRTAENFHSKFILTDPATKPKGFICTNNFTENGFSKNPELAIELTVEQCEELFKIFVYHFWEHSTQEQTATNEFATVNPTGKFNLSKLENILLTSPNSKRNSLNKSLLSAVNKAKESISFSTFLLDKNIDLVKAICDKAKQNVAVTLFCRPIEKQFNDQLKELLESGVQIYFHPFTHSKSLLIDNKDGYVFTANLTGNGLESGFEVGLKLNEEQIKDLSLIHQNWQVTFPARAVKSANVKDLQEVEIFKDGKLTRKILLDDKKDEKRKAVNVAGLFHILNQKFDIKDDFTKTLKVKITAEIDTLPEKYKVNGVDKFEILEVEEVKGKKSKIVVLKDTFDETDLNQLLNLKDCRVYFALDNIK
jgi:phosphatidylserine/phosphatidylglycerophosphate/cardiolipin synthase-like enzyme